MKKWSMRIGVLVAAGMLLAAFFLVLWQKNEISNAGAPGESQSTSSGPESSEESASGGEPASSEESASAQGSSAQPEPSSSQDASSQPESSAQSEPPGRGEVELSMTFVGDCTLGTDEYFYYGTSFNAYYDENGPDYFLELVRDLFEKDDLTVINMEGTLTTEAERQEGKEFCFKGPPEYVEILTGASVEAANLANNHSFDYGDKSYTDTIEIMEGSGIPTFGYDRTAIVEVKGVKVGFFGLMELFVPAEDLILETRDRIRELREKGAELMVAVYHWGYELMRPPHEDQIMLGHLAIDEGADIVIGHHPHIVQGIERYKGKIIAYSLGNFCFGGNDGAGEMDTMILKADFHIDEEGQVTTTGIEVVPCLFTSEDWHNNYQPSILEGEAAEETLGLIQRRSELVMETLAELELAGLECEVYDPVEKRFMITEEPES